VSPTPISLLERLRANPDAVVWQRLVDLYMPLIRGWLQRDPTLRDEADDLVQDILGILVRELPHFDHRHPGAFRGWLRTITINRLNAHWRQRRRQPQPVGGSGPESLLSQLEDPASALSRRWDQEHDWHVAHRLLDLLEPEFTAGTWKAFRRVVLEERKPAEVAVELGLSVNAVLLAKSRVLRRLREEGRGLLG